MILFYSEQAMTNQVNSKTETNNSRWTALFSASGNDLLVVTECLILECDEKSIGTRRYHLHHTSVSLLACLSHWWISPPCRSSDVSKTIETKASTNDWSSEWTSSMLLVSREREWMQFLFLDSLVSLLSIIRPVILLNQYPILIELRCRCAHVYMNTIFIF